MPASAVIVRRRPTSSWEAGSAVESADKPMRTVVPAANAAWPVATVRLVSNAGLLTIVESGAVRVREVVGSWIVV